MLAPRSLRGCSASTCSSLEEQRVYLSTGGSPWYGTGDRAGLYGGGGVCGARPYLYQEVSYGRRCAGGRERGIIVWLVHLIGHIFGVANAAFPIQHKDRALQQPPFLDEHSIVAAKL